MQQQSNAAERALRPSPLTEAGISYSAAAIFYFAVSLLLSLVTGLAGEKFASSDWARYLSYLLPQLCFAAAALLFFRRSRTPVRTVYAGCRWHYYLLAILLAFGLLSLSEVNGYFIELLKKIGYQEPQNTPLPDVTGWGLLPALLVIALLPALFEETLFRGIQAGTMQRSGWGTAATVFLSGALFALFHGNPAQTLYQFACGVSYALLAVRSGSPFPTMLTHFANNALILCLLSAGYAEIPAAVKLPLYITAGVCLVLLLVYLAVLDRGHRAKGGVCGGKRFFLGASVGIALYALQWILVLVERCGWLG